MLKRRKVCDTYLTHACRHCWSSEPSEKIKYIVFSANNVAVMKATVLAESSIYFTFLLGSLCPSDVYRCEWGRCRTLSFFLTFFIISPFQVFILYYFKLYNTFHCTVSTLSFTPYNFPTNLNIKNCSKQQPKCLPTNCHEDAQNPRFQYSVYIIWLTWQTISPSQ